MYTKNNYTELLHISNIDCFCVNLTNRCNLSCVYCEHRSDDLSKRIKYEDNNILLDDEIITKIAPYIHTVQLAGSGEPTLHNNFVDIIKKINKHQLNSVIVTNFNSKFTECELSALSKVSRVTISLDTFDETTLAETRIHANIQQIVYNIVRLQIISQKHKNTSLEIYFNCVVNDKSITFIEDLALACVTLGLKGIYFNDLIIYPIVKKEKSITLTPSYIDEEHRIQNMKKLHHSLQLLKNNNKEYFLMPSLKYAVHNKYDRIIYNNGAAYIRLDQNMTRNCLLPWSTFVMTKHGMAPCCGNFAWKADIRGQHFLDIINSNEYIQLREQLLTGNLGETCATCSYADIISVKSFRQKIHCAVSSGSVSTWKRWHIQDPVHKKAKNNTKKLRENCEFA